MGAVLDYLVAEQKRLPADTGQPMFVILDLRLPKVDGMEVLRRVKSDPILRRIPVTDRVRRRRTEKQLAFEPGLRERA